MPEKIPFASVRPGQSLDLLSQREMASLATTDQSLHQLFRRCALAVLNTGGDTDDAREVYQRFEDFDLEVVSESRGVKLELSNAPAQAFVDGVIIEGIRNHLFSALRDIVFTQHKFSSQAFGQASPEEITDAVFRILRNADVVRANRPPKLIVCWGGHSISRQEYEFCKDVGYQLGLRGFDIATGCGPGAMKGPMKGAAIGHAKQLNRDSRFIGISEPGIIAAESPNAIVNELVILPDIEKRLEAFVRLAHGIIVFPGGAGTAEELLFLLGVKLHPANAGIPFPLLLVAPRGSEDYFARINDFLTSVLGPEITDQYEIVCGDAAAAAKRLGKLTKKVRRQRVASRESFSFNWNLVIPEDLQTPFDPSHDNMAALKLQRAQPVHELIAELRRAFSGIVAGNVKDAGVRAVEEHGPYQLHGDPEVVAALSDLLASFVAQGRMTLDTDNYRPCFTLAG